MGWPDAYGVIADARDETSEHLNKKPAAPACLACRRLALRLVQESGAAHAGRGHSPTLERSLDARVIHLTGTLWKQLSANDRNDPAADMHIADTSYGTRAYVHKGWSVHFVPLLNS